MLAAALTLRAVARRAGVSHIAPYRHFADKEALLAAIAEEGFVELADRLDEARARVPASLLAQLEESGWAYAQFALAHPDHVRVMFDVPVTEPQAYPGLLAAGSRAFNVLVEIIEAGQSAGENVAGNSQQLAFAAWSMAHGLGLLLANRRAPPEVWATNGQEQLVRLCLRQQRQGFVPRL
jgi:AcrR family transcriptional regulator